MTRADITTLAGMAQGTANWDDPMRGAMSTIGTAVDTVDGLPATGDIVTSTTINSIVSLTQAAYDALTPDPATLYIITG